MEAALAHDDSVAMFLLVRYPPACLPRVRPVGLFNAARSSFEETSIKDIYDIPFPPHEIRATVKSLFFFFFFLLKMSLSIISLIGPPSLPPFLPPSFLSRSAPRSRLLINERALGLRRANPTFQNPSLTHLERNYRSHALSCFFVLRRRSGGQGRAGQGRVSLAWLTSFLKTNAREINMCRYPVRKAIRLAKWLPWNPASGPYIRSPSQDDKGRD